VWAPFYTLHKIMAGLLDMHRLAGNEQALVLLKGMAAWTPYGEVARAQRAAVGVPPQSDGAAGGLICSECGRTFAPDQVISYGDRWVCAACKPIFLQRLREGVALAGAGPRPTVTEAELLARDYDVDVGACITRGWELYKGDVGTMIGMSVLGYLPILVVSWAAGALLGVLHVRFLTFLVLFFSAPMMAGLWLFYIKKVRGQEAGAGDVFAGFGPKYLQLVLAALFPGALSFGFSEFLTATLGAGRTFSSTGSVSAEWLLPIAIITLILAVALVYLGTCWRFAIPLVMDKGLKFWPALQLSRRIVTKHWWMNFALIFACSLLGGLGVIACCVGVLVTGPVAFAAVTYQYEQVFGDLAPRTD
jgi:hypothetical protein